MCLPCVFGSLIYIVLGVLMSFGIVLGYRWRRFIARLMRKVSKKKIEKERKIQTNRFLREDEDGN